MDGKANNVKKKNPREGANPLSALTFAWVLKIFWTGYKRDLEIEDLTKPLKEHTSSVLGEKIAKAWEDELESVEINQQKKKKKLTPSLRRVLIKVFGARIALYGVASAFMEIVLRVLQPLALGKLLKYYSKNTNEDDAMSKSEAQFYAGAVIMCSAANIFVTHPYKMAIYHMGMKIRVACCSLIYRKSLRLSRTALSETSIGQAVNLLSNDVSRFDVAIVFLHYFWIGPLQTIIITYFMYCEVGIAAVIGVASLLMFIPFLGWLGKRSSILRLKTAIRTDERVRLTNEIISGIQAIKMYTWEYPFSRLIEQARKKEINVIRSTSYINSLVMSFAMFTTRLSLFLTILAFIYQQKGDDDRAENGAAITAEKVFMLTAYYNILRQTMTLFSPRGITQIAEANVSITRLQNFMMREEIDSQKLESSKYSEEYHHLNTTSILYEAEEEEEEMEVNSLEGSIIIDRASARWLASDREETLDQINMKVKPGQFVAIVGQVGSGKSSLLNVILKELAAHQGTVDVRGKIAYACQEPWLFVGSVRTNILFGRKMDHKRYDQVVKVCQLKRDFQLFPYGDKTIVGERGVSLSGGQRARINLARAVYADDPIYLFDDPLSAVDAHVGKHMFEECIEKYLKGKTRILVTHQIQFLRNVDKIIVMKEGSIEAEGTYDELVAMGVDFGRLSVVPSKEEDLVTQNITKNNPIRTISISSLSSLMTNISTNIQQEEPKEIAEMRTKGSIGGKVYSSYFSAGGNCCLIFVVFLLCCGAQFFASAGDFFIAFWVNLEEKFPNSTLTDANNPDIPLTRDFCIYIYTGITIATIIVTIVRSMTFFGVCMRASRRLHDRMFRSISRATMRFFNTNPSGRVLNRFSKDMGTIDESLPMTLIDCLQMGLMLLGIMVIVAIVNPPLLIPTFLIGIIFYFLRVIYLATSRSIKRLEGITRSPVFSHLNATLQGLPTIRAFDASEMLIKEFDHHQDLHSSAWYIFIASSRAFGFWIDIFCLIYITLVTLSFLVLPEDSTKGGNVGLAITQSIGLTGMLQWFIRDSTLFENQMTSVERVCEYTNLEREPPLESSPDKKPKEDWPLGGKIEFKEVFMSYAPLEPPVLKNLNFTINEKEKVGIVGRTGAGKSSLISALFRLANLEGSIGIDGINIGEIGLHDLRSKVSIIPQEPFLFAGTLRRNLDPFDSYSDALLWSALEDVELKEMGLTAHVNEGGSNLSVGQRQLVCLARAIIKNNRILILDEATANVDSRTDELIQKTIRHKFAECTVLTIAHRLNTVMDSDKILVMDAGTVVEFDIPHLLLQNPEGALSSMIQETDKDMAEILTSLAKDNFLQEKRGYS